MVDRSRVESEVQRILRAVHAAEEIELTLEVDEPCDESGLRPVDYTTLYALLPPSKDVDKKRWDSWSKEPKREATWQALTRCAEHYSKDVDLLAEAKVLQRHNKKSVRVRAKPKKAFQLNASRVADALFILGMEVLVERVKNVDSERSAREDAGKGKNKLPNTGRRKAA